jgi:acetyl esterase
MMAVMAREKLSPEARALLEEIDSLGLPALQSLVPAAARVQVRESSKRSIGEPVVLERVENFCVPAPAGSVPVRLYARERGGVHPCLVYFHGGGYVVCDLDTHDTVCRWIAKESGAIVIAVDYRLAPEHRFPAALEDCQAAAAWVCANGEQLGVDANRIAVGGDSAGGNLAAVVSIQCRDAGGPPLALQVLVYPVTNCNSLATDSYREFAEDHHLTRGLMDYFFDHYFARAEDRADPKASPLLAKDLQGLPPALVITAECDPLRDEGEAYAARLAEAGVTVTCTRYKGMFHPFFSLPGILEDSRKAVRQVAGALRRM